MPYRVEFAPAAVREPRRLPPEIQMRLASSIRRLAGNPRPEGVRKIWDESQAWRIRIGNYRVVYEVLDDLELVVVLKIARRN